MTVERPTTGTSVYTLLKCRRAVALDLAEDRSRRRPYRDDEEFVLQRGRDHEDRIVAALGWPEPEFAARDWAAGAEATERFLVDGIEGLSQGILLGPDRLGIPDLLRREPGASKFGDYHYVVGDIKSSAKPRSDQLLQVVFYSELLAALQERAPDYGYLLLKDGREERFDLDGFRPAFRQVEREIEAIRADPFGVRPFFGIGCENCSWSEVCLPELEAADDLSLLPGVTRALRIELESAGVGSCAALLATPTEEIAQRCALEPPLLRQLARAAEARSRSTPLVEARARDAADPGARGSVIVHAFTDPFAERVLWFGILGLADAQNPDAIRDAVPRDREAEWPAFAELVASLTTRTRVWHYGKAIPEWFEDRVHGVADAPALDRQFVDLSRRLRGAAMFPGPAFGLADHVRMGLGREPHRNGRASGAALHAEAGDVEWLRAKGRSDLLDLAALHARWLAPDNQVATDDRTLA